MKVMFIIGKSLRAAIKTIICTVFVCGVYYWINEAIPKKPVTVDELTVAIATFAIFLHFSEKEERQ